MRTSRFLALGDSYTIGEAVDARARWPMQLVARLRERDIAIDDPQIIAVTGWTTDELAAAMDHAQFDPPYALVSLLIGVNNQYRGRDLRQYAQQFDALLRRAIDLAGNDPTRVLVVSIPDWGATPFGHASGRDLAGVSAQIDAFNAAAREHVIQRGAYWIDITPISRDAAHDPALTAPDGLHPSAAMYARWVDLIAPVAQRRLAADTAPRR
ncbi:MAG: SGNH/GDSL hydrolase family protein [Proteobacteria bacterium]|nr:SGNH/GDSL hydrolase family protein [Pseudomonadota bacterium]MBS0463081.1 SGNH/GDSL hydrolase family protein [Pseudomonadota bacterium]MBS0463792.1 SGNH/GDSL hydrolase family protein [Pseudomonadota bacterium]